MLQIIWGEEEDNSLQEVIKKGWDTDKTSIRVNESRLRGLEVVTEGKFKIWIWIEFSR